MGNWSIMDTAADVRAKAAEVKARCEDLRRFDNDAWISGQLAADEALEIARSGLQNAWRMLDRIHSMLPEPKHTPPAARRGEE